MNRKARRIQVRSATKKIMGKELKIFIKYVENICSLSGCYFVSFCFFSIELKLAINDSIILKIIYGIIAKLTIGDIIILYETS